MNIRNIISCLLVSALALMPAAALAKPKATVTRAPKSKKADKPATKAPKAKKSPQAKKLTSQQIGHMISRKLSKGTVRNSRNILDNKYFSSSLKLSDRVRDLAMATQEVSFVKATSKNVVTCRYQYMLGKSTLTKFNKEENNLLPVKSEDYMHFLDGPQKCIRKGLKGRATLPLSEGVARAIRATTNPLNMSILSPIDLYNSVTPTWIFADSAEDVEDWINCLEEDQAEAGIAPQMRDDLLKPTCIITIKNDLFLETINPAVWAKLERSYNMTTFLDHGMRKHFWTTKNRLVEARKIAKAGLDLNPNLLEGIFADLEAASCYFSHKDIIRQTIKEISKKVFYWGIPALIIAMSYKGIMAGWNWATSPSAEQQLAAKDAAADKAATAKARELAAQAYLNKQTGNLAEHIGAASHIIKTGSFPTAQ